MRGAELLEHGGNERLATETGFHAHHQQRVDAIEPRFDRRERRVGLERETDLAAEVADAAEQRVGVAHLHVHRDAIRSRVGECVEQITGVGDHQMAVEVERGGGAQRLHHRRADREVRHVVAIHAIDMQAVGFVADALDVIGEMREVGSEYRRRDLERHHPKLPSGHPRLVR